MNIALWVAQGLLALMFAMVGAMKMTQPIDKLAKRMTWVHDVSPSTVRLIALLEVLGAIESKYAPEKVQSTRENQGPTIQTTINPDSAGDRKADSPGK